MTPASSRDLFRSRLLIRLPSFGGRLSSLSLGPSHSHRGWRTQLCITSALKRSASSAARPCTHAGRMCAGGTPERGGSPVSGSPVSWRVRPPVRADSVDRSVCGHAERSAGPPGQPWCGPPAGTCTARPQLVPGAHTLRVVLSRSVSTRQRPTFSLARLAALKSFSDINVSTPSSFQLVFLWYVLPVLSFQPAHFIFEVSFF